MGTEMMSLRFLNVCLILAVVCNHTNAKCLFWVSCSEEDLIMLTPLNPIVYLGENVTLSCRSRKPDHDLAVHVNNAIVPAGRVQTLDRYTVRTTLAEVDMDLNHANLRCDYRYSTKPGCGACQILNVFEPPEPVVNVSCVVHDWTSDLNCTWALGRHYRRPPEVTLKWRIPGVNCAWTPCPGQNPNYCLWGSTHDGGDFSMKTIDLGITVKSGVRQTTSFYRVNTRTIVKAGAAEQLHSRTINNSCVEVGWRSARRQYRKLYRVAYHSKWTQSQGCKYIEDSVTNKSVVLLCGLIPATTYHISVQVHAVEDLSMGDGDNAARDHGNCTDPSEEEVTCLTGRMYWSDKRTTETSTYGDVPSAAPAMTEGGFMWRSVEKGYRRVSVFWQPIPDVHMNGHLKGYDVAITSSTGIMTRHALASYVTFDIMVLRTDVAYEITVQGRNANGSSPTSTMNIPPSKQVIAPPEFIVSILNKTNVSGDQREVEVTWNGVSADPDVTGFTLFTCKKEGGNCAFQQSAQWWRLSRNQSATVIKVEYPDQKLYGLSVHTKQGSSGFHWHSCVYTKGESLREAPGNLHVHAGTGDSSLFVSWDLLPCGSGMPEVSVYRVRYCEAQTQQHKCHVKTVSAKKNTVILNDMLEEQLYNVSIQGVTTSGTPGPWSKLVQKTTNEVSDVGHVRTVGIVVGIVGGILFVLCIAGICNKQVKPRCKPPGVEDLLKGIPVPEDIVATTDRDAHCRQGIQMNNNNNNKSEDSVEQASLENIIPGNNVSDNVSSNQHGKVSANSTADSVLKCQRDQNHISDTDQTLTLPRTVNLAKLSIEETTTEMVVDLNNTDLIQSGYVTVNRPVSSTASIETSNNHTDSSSYWCSVKRSSDQSKHSDMSDQSQDQSKELSAGYIKVKTDTGSDLWQDS